MSKKRRRASRRGVQRLRRSAQLLTRFAMARSTQIGLVFAVIGIILTLGGGTSRPAVAAAAFLLGIGTTVLSDELNARRNAERSVSGSRLALLGRDVVERPVHVLYPDFVVGPGHDSRYERNIRERLLPDSIAFKPVNLVFSRHVAKEDMDSVRFLGYLFGEIGLDSSHAVVRRDSAFLQEILRPGALSGAGQLDEVHLLEALNDLDQSIIAIGLGSNLITRIYSLLPDSFLELTADFSVGGEFFEEVTVVPPANAVVITDEILATVGRESGLPQKGADVASLVAKHWEGCIEVCNPPHNYVGERAALDYRFRSSMSAERGHHFGFIIRMTTDPALERRVFILGGSGPVGTRAAGEYLYRSGRNLSVSLRALAERQRTPLAESADFLAVVHVETTTEFGPDTIDLIPATSRTEPRLIYMVAQSDG